MSADQIADVLAEHQYQRGIRDTRAHCICGWKSEPGLPFRADVHRVHLAEMLDPLIEAREQEAARKALLDAAYELTPSGMLWWGHEGVKVASEPYGPPTMGLTAWLRARAEGDA